MKILLATSRVSASAGIASYNRELHSLLVDNNEIHLLVDEKLAEFPGYTKVFTTFGSDLCKYEDVENLCGLINDEKYDVIINSNSHFLSLLTPYISDNIRIVSISHSLGTMDCDGAAYNNKYVDNIVALSENCRQYISRRFFIKKEKITVIFNSVEEKENASVLREQKKTACKLKIVFAGGTASSKSPDIVVPIIWELCKSKLHFEFYWLGITTPPLKRFQPYQDVRLVLPKDERVIVTGAIPQPQAAEIIASCNIFLAPSRREGFPMALLEAMRVGCIPIVSDFDIANKEIIDNNVNGYIIPHRDITVFVDRITDIILHHEQYGIIYNNSFKTFEELLRFPIWLSKIDSLIRSNLINHKHRKKIRKCHFVLNVTMFKLLEWYNLLENHIKEVLPCAWKFYGFYKKYNK